MSDKPAHVLLITTDERMRAMADECRPAHASLECVTAQEVTASRAAGAAEIWIDLDAAPGTVAVGGDRRVYFHSRPQPPPENLPRGWFIPKPCALAVFQVLWAGVGTQPTAASADKSPKTSRTLPIWLLDFQELDLKRLCHKCVTVLPDRLGYRVASFYVHDSRHGLLKLADTTHSRAIDEAVPLAGANQNLMSAIAQSGHVLRTDEVAAELASRGLPEHPDRPYDDAGCLVAPLISDSRLWGALTFTGRVTTATPTEAVPLEELFAFLGRALHHACVYEEAQFEARVDGLTGLYNQRWMMEALEKEIRRATRFSTPLSVLMIDLDGLKAVNDRVGHAAGDCLLRHVAGRIAAVLRQFDGAARVGGDEFVVMLPATNLKGARHVAGRLLESIRDEAAEFGQQALPITASVGAVEWCAGWDAHKLIDAADRAMYCAKTNGRDRLVCQSPQGPGTVRLGAASQSEDRPPARTHVTGRRRASSRAVPEMPVPTNLRRDGLSESPPAPVRERRTT